MIILPELDPGTVLTDDWPCQDEYLRHIHILHRGQQVLVTQADQNGLAMNGICRHYPGTARHNRIIRRKGTFRPQHRLLPYRTGCKLDTLVSALHDKCSSTCRQTHDFACRTSAHEMSALRPVNKLPVRWTGYWTRRSMSVLFAARMVLRRL